MKRRVYDVVRNDGAWCVRRRGATRAVARAATQRAAAAAGRKLARAAWAKGETAQLVVHGRRGRIVTEFTYGADPFPPVG